MEILYTQRYRSPLMKWVSPSLRWVNCFLFLVLMRWSDFQSIQSNGLGVGLHTQSLLYSFVALSVKEYLVNKRIGNLKWNEICARRVIADWERMYIIPRWNKTDPTHACLSHRVIQKYTWGIVVKVSPFLGPFDPCPLLRDTYTALSNSFFFFS